LKHLGARVVLGGKVVRLDNPLKQGLKPDAAHLASRFGTVRLDNPLKQGLKH